MKTTPIFVALWLFVIAFNVLAKDADSSGVNKNYIDSGKRERRQVPPENLERSANWQPYLRWHRDATALGATGDGFNVGGRPFIQL
jgi:hypothetical protein